MSYQSSNLGRWLDQVFATVFFQPNDVLSEEAVQDHFSPDLQAEVNNQRFTYAEYRAAIAEVRAQNFVTLEESRELLDVPEDKDGIGYVAHASRFKTKDKKTGAEKQESNVTLAKIVRKDGKRTLVQLTEISKEAN